MDDTVRPLHVFNTEKRTISRDIGGWTEKRSENVAMMIADMPRESLEIYKYWLIR